MSRLTQPDRSCRWSDADCAKCLENYDDIGCGEIDFEAFLQICVDESAFDENRSPKKPTSGQSEAAAAAPAVDIGALRKELRLEMQETTKKVRCSAVVVESQIGSEPMQL